MPVDLSQKLSDHFALHEFIDSQTASRKGIDNTPSQEVVDRLRKLCTDILEPARAALGPMRISSGFRCEKLNVAIGGSKTSAHCKGYAADVIPFNVTRREFAKWVKDHCNFDQIILEFGTPENPDWIHVSNEPRFRKQILRTANGGYVAITV
jgi:hypothetical protein